MPLNVGLDPCELWPHWYRKIKDFQQICAAEGAMFQQLESDFDDFCGNYFFQTMDENAVAGWESTLGILANPSTETLDFRRARLLNRLSMRPPFTLAFLYEKLDELIGVGEWQVTVDAPNSTIYVKSSAINQSYAIEVSYTINRIKPAHIVYVNQPYITETLDLNESVALQNTEYNYALGQWQLGQLPFATYTDMGVIVLPDQLSLQPALLSDVANFISSDIASAQINGSVTIASLTKSVSGGLITVQYSVAPTQATTVTQIALLNASGSVLSQAAVYVPVPEPVIISHTITVQEAIPSGS